MNPFGLQITIAITLAIALIGGFGLYLWQSEAEKVGAAQGLAQQVETLQTDIKTKEEVHEEVRQEIKALAEPAKEKEESGDDGDDGAAVEPGGGGGSADQLLHESYHR